MTDVESLINKLNKYLVHHYGGSLPPVSPTSSLGKTFSLPGFIFKKMDLKNMQNSEIQLLHTNLHRFYPRGIGDIKKEDIEQLHKEVKKHLMLHYDFDQLDKK